MTVFKVGYPAKDSDGNAIDTPDGIQLEVLKPGAVDFVPAGSCIFPETSIPWVHERDGKYAFRTRCFTFAVKGPGCGSCKRFGPPSANIEVTVKDARPTAPPTPVALGDGGGCCSAPTLSIG